MNWNQFAILKHWIRTSNLRILELRSDRDELQILHRVCMFLGMDKLSQALYDNIPNKIDYDNPMNPKEDNKVQYLWLRPPDFEKDQYYVNNVEEWTQKVISDGYSQVGTGIFCYCWWRKPK